ncbi:MAG: methionine adenosyltransferase [Spirochaetaceae bacterium]|jgi:S-adenosylmethionine synthetase|nr:methionine adenosyltransferase [Spirochaetaceae bacterium]
MSNKRYFFTSESVSEGHPDKVCDQISDAVLDACLAQDGESHVACETYASTAFVLVGGEITTATYVDVQATVRGILREIGYTDAEYGIDCDSTAVANMIHSQSPDINQGVIGKGLKEYEGLQGAGDQGIMFGFACTETAELMPAPIMAAHSLLLEAAALRKSGKLPWLRPDAKSQVTVEYEGHTPLRIDAVVLSHQHAPDIAYGDIRESIIEGIIKPVLGKTGLLDKNTKFFINPTGRFVIGGPFGDTGLTGRKIIVDTYGGMARHGGGAFSGKDPSKVDRSASYMARYIAKNVVAAGLAERCELQLAYAIGVPFPIAVMVDTQGTGKVDDSAISRAVTEVFDCSPSGIITTLDLKKPIYQKTSNYGHFGRRGFRWEETDKAEAIKRAIR